MGGGFHMAGPEADIRNTAWVNYTIEVLNEPETVTPGETPGATPEPEPTSTQFPLDKMVISLRLKQNGDNYATCAGEYVEYPEMFQDKKVFYNEALHRIILNY